MKNFGIEKCISIMMSERAYKEFTVFQIPCTHFSPPFYTNHHVSDDDAARVSRSTWKKTNTRIRFSTRRWSRVVVEENPAAPRVRRRRHCLRAKPPSLAITQTTTTTTIVVTVFREQKTCALSGNHNNAHDECASVWVLRDRRYASCDRVVPPYCRRFLYGRRASPFCRPENEHQKVAPIVRRCERWNDNNNKSGRYTHWLFYSPAACK